MRKTETGWVAVYDYLESLNPKSDGKHLWQQAIAVCPELKTYSEILLFIHEYSPGRKTPVRTPCLHENALVLLDTAVREVQSNSAKPKSQKQKLTAPLNSVLIPTETNVETVERVSAEILIIGGRVFKSTEELHDHVTEILRSTPANTYLKGADLEFMMDLVSRHNLAKSTLANGLIGVKVVRLEGKFYKNFSLHVPGRMQKISITNYLSPASKPLFEVKLLQPA